MTAKSKHSVFADFEDSTFHHSHLVENVVIIDKTSDIKCFLCVTVTATKDKDVSEETMKGSKDGFDSSGKTKTAAIC